LPGEKKNYKNALQPVFFGYDAVALWKGAKRRRKVIVFIGLVYPTETTTRNGYGLPELPPDRPAPMEI
jgi:hypothetical protein